MKSETAGYKPRWAETLWLLTLGRSALVTVPVNAFVAPKFCTRTATPSRVGTQTCFRSSSAVPSRRRLSVPLGRTVLDNAKAPGEEKDDDNDEDESSSTENPYADPNYPDLEFINYDDPEYSVDQGEEMNTMSADSTEVEIEAMREDRRRRNDEFQFQTYYRDTLRDGGVFKGEWTVYRTCTFLDDDEVPETGRVDANGMPRILEAPDVLHVISQAHKLTVEAPESDPFTMSVDAERIVHVQRLAEKEELGNPLMTPRREASETTSDGTAVQTAIDDRKVVNALYAPEQLSALDFRGTQGIMCVGNGYTTSVAVPLDNHPDGNTDPKGTLGPFAEYRTEVGIQTDAMRFRIKLDYSVLKKELGMTKGPPPPLRLKTMTVCRETVNEWPRMKEVRTAADQAILDALFGTVGAQGGLYDPPPVGGDIQATRYMLIPLEGRATVLFPYQLDQDDTFEKSGWVTSLDWTPGPLRFQVDRKVQGQKDLLCLRTLELSEVQSAEADQWRPRDGGEDMRQ